MWDGFIKKKEMKRGDWKAEHTRTVHCTPYSDDGSGKVSRVL